jgi:predicted ATP-grasp superfamily ATP-dependent carboligase
VSVIEKLFGYAQEVMLLTQRVEGLTKATEKLSEQYRELDRRVVRIETLIELAREQQSRFPER